LLWGPLLGELAKNWIEMTVNAVEVMTSPPERLVI
jgi:hypothetical protein